jgi:hypothetical protein
MSPSNFHHSMEFRVASCIDVSGCGNLWVWHLLLTVHEENSVRGSLEAKGAHLGCRPTEAKDLFSPQIARESELLPRSGDVLRVTKAASVQFSQPMLFRVIRVHDWMTYDGWAWLDGYQLNAAGDAVERRSIFVQLNGLQPGYLTRQRVPVRIPAMV